MISKYSEYLSIFEEYLKNKIPVLTAKMPKVLAEAVSYAVSDGGKRVRPVLCLAVADILGVSFNEVLNYSLAIECIHSYSLVHDDLPAMDNDDYRRGKLSTHKKFGEANGILAGDALLNLAFEVCFDKNVKTEKDFDAIKLIADYAGGNGMIKGQVLDLENEKSLSLSKTTLYDIYENKTAKLIMAPILVSSILSGKKYFNELKEYGYNLGVLFQIIDDIMDEEGTLDSIGKTPHKDKDAGKVTAISIFGLAGAKELAEKHYKTCKTVVSSIPNNKFLLDFADMMYLRKK